MHEHSTPYIAIENLFTLIDNEEIFGNKKYIFIQILKFLKNKGVLHRIQINRLKKKFVFHRKIKLPIFFSTETEFKEFKFRCSNEKFARLIKVLKLNENNIYCILKENEPEKLLNFYASVFKDIGLFKSNYNSRCFLNDLFEIKKKRPFSSAEYQLIRRKILRAKAIFREKKYELDHFPPNDLYHYAKDPYIKNLNPGLRPVWRILRTKHRGAISTGRRHISNSFRSEQRKLFAMGQYGKSIENYLKMYIDSKIIVEKNFHQVKIVLQKCMKVRLIDKKDLKNFQVLIGF